MYIKLTEKQWEQLIDFYDQGHTMIECAKIWKITPGCISQKFKKIGKKARPRFIPTTEEKRVKLKDGHYMKNAVPSYRGDLPKEVDLTPPKEEPRIPGKSKRRIIQIGKENRSKYYEKDIT